MSRPFDQWLHIGRVSADRLRWAMANRRHKNKGRRPEALSLDGLERRLLMSATPMDASMLSVETADGGATTEIATEIQTDHDETSQVTIDASADNSNRSVGQNSAIVFVDATVPDLESMLSDLQRHSGDYDVFVLNSDQDGIEQITEILSGRSDIDSIHVITHGDGDTVRLGNVTLGQQSLNAYAGQVASWGAALNSDADLLFYGCDLARTESGRDLIESVAALTGADVAASIDDTGHWTLGADWNLEFEVGQIDTDVVFSSEFQDAWRAKLSVITVTTTSELNDTGSSSFDLTTLLANKGTDGQISLAEAIIAANNTNGLDTIHFNIAGAGPHVISLNAELPEITDTIVIDGTTQPGFIDRPVIFLDGNDQFENGIELRSGSAGSTIRGLGIINFAYNGIFVDSSSNTIAGNWVGGFDPVSGANDSSLRNGQDGIFVSRSNNTIGGPNVSDRNVIGENNFLGVLLFGSNASDNVVRGNWIGITPDGSSAAPLGLDGIGLFSGADGNTISQNVVGNARHGIHLYDASDNVITGNAVGTDFAMTSAFGNAQKGIRLAGDSDDNEIGRFGEGNLIVGNGLDGIAVLDSSTRNTIRFNQITGNGQLPIDLDGDGSDVNDLLDFDSGGNDRQNRPVLSNASVSANGELTVALELSSEASQNYRIDFYEASTEAGSEGDPVRYLGFSIVSTSVTGQVNGIAIGIVSGVADGDLIVATATDIDGNTSEFSSSTAAVLINTAPSLANVETQQLDYIENSGPQIISSSITVSDADAQPLQSATVTISDYLANQDVLTFSDLPNITGTWNATTGVLTLTGNASIAEYQAALRSVTYENTSDTPSSNPRTIRFTVFDGAESSSEVVRVVVPIPTDDPTTGKPTITGQPTEDQTLTASTTGIVDPDGLSAPNFTYQWLNNGVAISGATSASYTLTASDVGDSISVRVSLVDHGGFSSTVTSDPVGPIVIVDHATTGKPTITGQPTEDQTLTASTTGIADPDGLSAPNFTYQWLNNGVAISGATSASYTLAASDVGDSISVRVSLVDDDGFSSTVTSDPVGPIAIVDHATTGKPTITGQPTEDQTLTASATGIADPDGLSAPNFTYQWLNNGVAISGATSASYTLAASDVGDSISVRVSLVDDDGFSSTVTSDPVGPIVIVDHATTGKPTITGQPTEDQTLTASTTGIADPDGLSAPNFAYQWLNNGVAISGATSASFTLTASDVGDSISVRVSLVDDDGFSSTVTSDPVGPIAIVDHATTGKPTITGQPTEDQTLTASTTGIADPDGLSAPNFAYQWLNNGVAISGATSASYTLTASDVGDSISVRVSLVDDDGFSSAVTSDPVGPIAIVDHAATGKPTITGQPTEDETLTASTTGIADPDGLSSPNFTYQWYRDGQMIAGATAVDYRLGDGDVGSEVSVEVTFADDRGNATTLVSDATGPIANVNDSPVGLPSITGTLMETETLAADLSAITDADGVPNIAEYQWLRDGQEIKDANRQTYTLTLADVDHRISVRVTFTDLQGMTETVVSEPTPVIDNFNDAPTLSDQTRKIQFGQTLNQGPKLFENASEDIDGDSLKAVLVKGPESGTLDLRSDGSFRYTPDPAFFGTVTFTWQADDGALLSNVATVTIVIAPPINTPGDSTGSNGESGGQTTETGSSVENETSDGNEDGSISSGSNSGDSGSGTPTGGGGTTSNESVESSVSVFDINGGDGSTHLISFRAAAEDDADNRNGRGSLDDRIREFDALDTRDRSRTGNQSDRMSEVLTETNAWSDYAILGSPGQMWDQLDGNHHELEKLLESEQLFVGSFGAATGGFTVVALAWLRSGFLVLGFWQQRPLWSRMDPLVLMQGLSSEDDESLADVMAEQRRKLDREPDHDATE